MQIILDIDLEEIKDKTRIYTKNLIDQAIRDFLDRWDTSDKLKGIINEAWSSDVEDIVRATLADEPRIRAEVETEVRNKLKRQINLLMKEAKE